MKTRRTFALLLPTLAALGLSFTDALAFPPAPPLTVYGNVVDPFGWVVSDPEAVIIFRDLAGKELGRSKLMTGVLVGENYRVVVPLDHNRTGALYRPAATTALTPFTVSVTIQGAQYVPMEVVATPMTGAAAQFLRLDLTLGTDSDADGLPDEWEQWQLDAAGLNPTHLHLITPGADADGDGVTNLQEYLAGTFAYLGQDRLSLTLKERYADGWGRAEFVAIVGKTYTLERSADLVTWVPESFGLWANRAPLRSEWQADDTVSQTIQIPAPPAGHARSFYRLHVR